MSSSNGNIFRVTGHLCGEFPGQRLVTRRFDVFFDLRPNKRLSKQSWGWWSETPSSSLWRHRNERPSTGSPIHEKTIFISRRAPNLQYKANRWTYLPNAGWVLHSPAGCSVADFGSRATLVWSSGLLHCRNITMKATQQAHRLFHTPPRATPIRNHCVSTNYSKIFGLWNKLIWHGSIGGYICYFPESLDILVPIIYLCD